LGGGMVHCSHGVMPVPAPATAEILTGVPCRYDGIDQEATTPTGAAILKEIVDDFSAPIGFQAQRIGYGIGHKDFDIPNVLRVMLGTLQPAANTGLEMEGNDEIHCNIDDMPAEAFQPLMDRLLEAGARDVYLTPIIMKKARPATKVSVLCPPELTDEIQAILFANSTTIGVRVIEVSKRMLPRETIQVATSSGPVSVKVVTEGNGRRRWKLEHDEVASLATENGTDYLRMKARLDSEVSAFFEQGETL
jgi:uncharacterized protein (DUF111 family)